jgi:hypothetical protein
VRSPRARAEEALAIARDLAAAAEPVASEEIGGDPFCALCGADGWRRHDWSCPWRRARVLAGLPVPDKVGGRQ